MTGKDKFLKKYPYPDEALGLIDWKRAPANPDAELPSHAVGTTCWHESKEFKCFVTGGRDGTLIRRSVSEFEKPLPMKAHAVHSGGVTAICFSQARSTLYSAGGDGAVMAWTVGGKPNPSQPVLGDATIGLALEKMEQVERVPGS